ncbi:ABC transporter related protein [Paenibacillus curdlanolyticus YK9]|uniref:ABC transporter related protein n=1 Tax=Paenibacillus curdlanolyticus YK9 TaxID=717606 RepID=E0IFK2_9BACL|nr:ABC transporter ATP-binding protein [Paenibacillus curdlanolyticus]EFM08668.1 ABC transporter related protein [Paenibacillus curdlanolyticus YK9]
MVGKSNAASIVQTATLELDGQRGSGNLAVELTGICKSFGDTVALSGVDLLVEKGEIHALLGENGAGKSTLMSVLFGIYRADSGTVKLSGREARIRSPKDAAACGIGMVHQHFRLVPSMTALENIVLGQNGGIGAIWRGRGWKRRKAAEIAALCERYKLSFPLDRPVWQLSVGEQQRIEIMKALYRQCDIIVLDEPTAVLTPLEAESLLETLGELKKDGKTVILTTHKLREVMASCDRISVMRKGQLVRTVRASDTNEQQLAEWIMGRGTAGSSLKLERRTAAVGKPLLKLEAITALGDHGELALRGFDLTVRRGEIVGVAGVAGNGQKELAEVIAGSQQRTGGTVMFNGERLHAMTIQGMIKRGVAHVPENRMKSGMAGTLSVADNLLMKSYASPQRSTAGFLRRRANVAWAEEIVERFAVRTPGIGAPVRMLSGGNQQKLLFARELQQRPLLMVAVHPTQGLDVGAAEAVHQWLLKLRSEGSAVLLISEDLDELLKLSDRIVVAYNGVAQSEFDPAEASRTEIGLSMAGSGANGRGGGGR